MAIIIGTVYCFNRQPTAISNFVQYVGDIEIFHLEFNINKCFHHSSSPLDQEGNSRVYRKKIRV